MKHRPEKLGTEYHRWNGVLFGFVALLILLCTLFWGDNIGMSNNGDFGRVIAASSLQYGDSAGFFDYQETLRIDLSHGSAMKNITSILFGTAGLENYPAIHIFYVRMSVVASLVYNKLTGTDMTTYHIGVLGFFCAVLYAAVIGLLFAQIHLKRLWKDIILKLAGLLVLCDLGYVAYFNSLYGEGLEHIALIFCVAMLLRILIRKPTELDALWCAVATVNYGLMKFFNIPLAILLLVAFAGILLLRTGKKCTLIIALAGVLVMLGIWRVVPQWMSIETNYNAVFYGILRDMEEDTARAYLQDMGLSESLATYRDTNYYMEGVVDSMDDQQRMETEHINKGMLLKFYLTHPQRLMEQAKLTAMHCGLLRPFYMANYSSDNHPFMSYSQRMTFWSKLRNYVALDSFFGNLVIILVFFLLTTLQFIKRGRVFNLVILLLMLLGALAYAFLMPIILNGEGDLAKHMFAYEELIDLLLLSILAYILNSGEGKLPIRPIIGIALILILVAPQLYREGSDWRAAHASHDILEVGAYVTMGHYQGTSMTWLVAEMHEDGSLTLVYVGDVLRLPFDASGGNDWNSSSIRAWLNQDFLDYFSAEERAKLLTVSHFVLLSDYQRDEATSGTIPFVYSHIPVLADRNYLDAYKTETVDMVTLPDIRLVASMARARMNVLDGGYWLETAYYRTSGEAKFVRYMDVDGYLYYGAPDVSRAIHPVVEISSKAPISGDGSITRPFRLMMK